jgi:hypothetical protein
MLRRAFYAERAPLAGWLHTIADAMVTALRSFAERYGATIATELAQSAEAMVVPPVAPNPTSRIGCARMRF